MTSDRSNRMVARPSSGRATRCRPATSQHLATLETKLQLVRDYVGQVAGGYTTGLYLFGEGGIGKSYTVLEELERLKADYKVFNSRMTGRGLFNALETFPDSVHVLEDMEQVSATAAPRASCAAPCWGQRKDGGKGPMERPVTWSTYKMEHSFIFTGGIIMIANRPLDDLPELRALRTRIACMQLRATDGELTALMRSVALKGFEHEGRVMTPAECLGGLRVPHRAVAVAAPAAGHADAGQRVHGLPGLARVRRGLPLARHGGDPAEGAADHLRGPAGPRHAGRAQAARAGDRPRDRRVHRRSAGAPQALVGADRQERADALPPPGGDRRGVILRFSRTCELRI